MHRANPIGINYLVVCVEIQGILPQIWQKAQCYVRSFYELFSCLAFETRIQNVEVFGEWAL